jgi:hypothetical protein
MVYTGKSSQTGAIPHAHMLDLAIAGVLTAGAITTIAPADYRAIGVAAIGAIIGGLIAARVFRSKDQEPLEWMWGVSTLAGIAFSPALFDYLSIPVYDVTGHMVRAEVIPRSVSMMLALSTAVAAFSWGGLKAINSAWQKHFKVWLERLFGKGKEP